MRGAWSRAAVEPRSNSWLLLYKTVTPGGLQIYRIQKRYKNETRDARRARVGTGRLPAVTPRLTALLKQHGAELGHHACTAHSLAVHPRARHPSCPAGARGAHALVGRMQLKGTGCCLPYITHTPAALSGMH